MSRFLQEPVTAKDSNAYGTQGLSIGKSSMQGWRETMEDADIIELSMADDAPDLSCFGIFDGHGGSKVANGAAKILVDSIRDTEEFKKDHKTPASLISALTTGFFATDEKLKSHPDLQNGADEVGSTCVFAIVTPRHVIVANIGDSRCILSSANSKQTIQLSVDHKPEMEFEKARILKAEGTIFRGRVCGGVAVSRSFGDFWFKRSEKLKPHEQLVTAEPCVHVHTRTSDDEFMLLCCDGIFDVMTNEEVREFVRSKLKGGTRNAKEICEALLDECLKKGSRDNMSVILILFQNHSKAHRIGSISKTLFSKK